MDMMGHQFASQAKQCGRCRNTKMLRCSHADAGCWWKKCVEVQRDIDFAKGRPPNPTYLITRAYQGPTLWQKSQTLQQLELQVFT